MPYLTFETLLRAYQADQESDDPATKRNLKTLIHEALASQVAMGPGSESPDLYLYELYHSAKGLLGEEEGGVFQTAFDWELTRLALRFPAESQSDDYFAYLFSLVGLLKAADASEALVPIAKDKAGQLRGVTADGEDLHLRLLKAMLACGTRSPDALAVCLRDLDDPRYAEVCFDAIYRKNVFLGLANFPRFLDAHRQAPELLSSEIVLDVMDDLVQLRVNPAEVSGYLCEVGISDLGGFLSAHFLGLLELSAEVQRRLDRFFDRMLGWSTATIPYPETITEEERVLIDVGRVDFPTIVLQSTEIPDGAWSVLI